MTAEGARKRREPRPPEPGDQYLGIKTGIVKSFGEYAGRPDFGHITDGDGQDHFVHFSEVMGSGYRNLCRGLHVRFKSYLGKKGLYAKEVCVFTPGT